MDSRNASPLDLLQELEQASLGNQLTDTQAVVGETWRAFVFGVDGLNLAVPFRGQFGIVPSHALSPMPLTRSWVRGMTNIRGEIYTVVDFSEFIGRERVRVTRGCNLFLLPDQGLKSALLLNSRISLRTFSAELPQVSNDSFYPKLTPYLSRVVVDGDIEWGILDIDRLSQSRAFSQIGR